MANGPRTWTDTDLADVVRDFLRMEIIGIGHIAPRGAVHVTDRTILAHTGTASVFNRGTALDLRQPDVAFAEIEEFFEDLPHTLWLAADELTPEADELLRGHGYIPMPDQRGVATTSFPEDLARAAPDHHATLHTDPVDAAQVADVSASGFGLGVDDRLLFEDLARGILRHAKPWHHGAIYGIERDDRIVAVGSLLCTATAAGLSGLATMPMHRHQGHGTVIVSRALHDASALGYDVAVAVATPDTSRLIERLGFKPVIEYRVYRQTQP